MFLVNKKYIALGFMIFIVSCSISSNKVNLVKNGTMPGHEQTTIGKAFEASFNSPKWEYFEDNKGKKVVQFSGIISNKLHADAISEIVAMRQKNPDDWQMLIRLFNIAFENLMGSSYKQFSDASDNPYIKTLNQEFNCSGISWPGGNYAYPSCEDSKVSDKYANKVIDDFLNRSWAVGDPVTFQWVINVDGKTFQLQALESKSWGGINSDEIFKVIFK